MNELSSERDAIKALMSSATEIARKASFDNLKENGYSDPIVIVIYADGRKEFLYPRYNNQHQQAEAFERVSRHVRDTGAAGMVVALEMDFIPKGSTTTKDTLFIAQKSQSVSEYEAWILKEGVDQVEIGEKIGPAPITLDGMFNVFNDVN